MSILSYLDSETNEGMHGSLIDSHRRSSLSLQDGNILRSSEYKLTNDTDENKRMNLNEDTAHSSSHLRNVIESDDDDDDDDDDKEPTAAVAHSADFFRWTQGHRRVMLTFGTICVFAFMTGVEYAVVLPTAYDYVHAMTPIDVYVGLMLSAYSISGSIAGVIMGKISDMTGKVKILILVSNIFEIGGNILYFITNNIHIVILGRLIAGVGMGVVPPVDFLF